MRVVGMVPPPMSVAGHHGGGGGNNEGQREAVEVGTIIAHDEILAPFACGLTSCI
jgi:hypothetical protein